MKHLRIFNSMPEFESTKPSINTPFVVLEKGTPKVIYSNLKEITEPEIPNYLCFEAIEDNSTLKFEVNGDISPNLEYAVLTGEFSNYTLGDSISLNSGEKVYFRGNNTKISIGFNNYGHFVGTGKINISGNILSILSKDLNPIDSPQDWCFHRLFYNCKSIVSAKDLILPFNTVGPYSYYDMFSGCTSLTTAPELPATTLSDSCYNGMFRSCTLLKTAPALPATTLAANCYYGMFKGCTSLTTAPELPVTTLADYCYCSMFQDCSLTTAPALPAKTLASNCYNSMFAGCTSLTTAPELLATTLAERCYAGMFISCSNLTTAPELPAITPAERCYERMFVSCSSLTTIKCLAEVSANNFTLDWVTGVASSGTFIKSANATNWITGSNGIPSGWTVVNEP